MLIPLFQHDSICWNGVLVERPGKVCAAPYLLICGRLAPSSETEQGLERGHRLPAPIVAKDEFIKINQADRGSRRDRFRSANCCRFPMARSAKGSTDFTPLRRSIRRG